jgi:hypothetical protein
MEFDAAETCGAKGMEGMEPSWRVDAARIVEDLFRVTAAEAWDDLLELRANLLDGTDLNRLLDNFLACRERLEAAHYLPFYRLRRLLAGSLRLEASSSRDQAHVASLREALRKHRSLAEIRRAVTREVFEHVLDAECDAPVDLRVVERFF